MRLNSMIPFLILTTAFFRGQSANSKHPLTEKQKVEEKIKCLKNGDCHTVCTGIKSDFDSVEFPAAELLTQQTIRRNEGYCLTTKGDEYRQLGLKGTSGNSLEAKQTGDVTQYADGTIYDQADSVFQQEWFLGQGHNLPDQDCFLYAFKIQTIHSFDRVKPIPIPLTDNIKRAFSIVLKNNLPKEITISSEELEQEVEKFLEKNDEINYKITRVGIAISVKEQDSIKYIKFQETINNLFSLLLISEQKILENESGQIMEYIPFGVLNIALRNL